jgi:hypothetical protein
VMSLRCPPARRGQATHTAPFGRTRSPSDGSRAGSSAASAKNAMTTSADPCGHPREHLLSGPVSRAPVAGPGSRRWRASTPVDRPGHRRLPSHVPAEPRSTAAPRVGHPHRLRERG